MPVAPRAVGSARSDARGSADLREGHRPDLRDPALGEPEIARGAPSDRRWVRVFRDVRRRSFEIRCPQHSAAIRARQRWDAHPRPPPRTCPAPEWRGHVRLVGFAVVTRLIGLFTGLLAVSAVSAQVHVPSSAASPGFLASRGVPAVWLPELDAGIPMSGARVFVPGNVDAGRGVPLAFALDGSPIPLTINVDLHLPRHARGHLHRLGAVHAHGSGLRSGRRGSGPQCGEPGGVPVLRLRRRCSPR